MWESFDVWGQMVFIRATTKCESGDQPVAPQDIGGAPWCSLYAYLTLGARMAQVDGLGYARPMPTQDVDRPGLWARTRRAGHQEIAETAMRLFIAQGFDATTIEQIANEVGISRRSFFRYFGAKEDIVLGDLAERGVAVKIALEARPASEPPWEALRAALESLRAHDVSSETTLRISKMLYQTPSLRARHLEKQLHWQALLVPNIQTRLGPAADGVPDVRAQAIVACALVCLDTAGEIWTRGNAEGDLSQIFDQALAAVRA